MIYHLIHNDDENFTSIVDLDIDLCRSDLDQWDRLLMGLSRNRTVKSIELSRGYQSPVVTEDDLQRLFSALRHLPRLSKVKLDSFTTFDLEQTKSLFENHDTIEEIWIENAQCHLEDENHYEDYNDEDNHYEDYNRYQRFLGYLSSTSRNRLRHLRIEIPEKLSHGANLVSLLDGSSKLESLVIETTSVMSSTSPSMLRARPNEDDRHRKFAAAMAALQSNLALKTLDIDFHISFSDFKDVATMLQRNKTLTDLCLRLEPSPGMIYRVSNGSNHSHDYHSHFIESIQLFFEALKINTKSALKVFSQYNVDNRGFRSAVSAHDDTHLSTSEMNLTFTKRAQKLIESGLCMLQYNLSLQYFSFFLFYHNPNLMKKKDMFLRLNERGRRSVQHRDIRETVPKSSWVDQLSKHSVDDLDGLYYYLSMNPSICRTIKEDSTCSTLIKIRTVTVIDKNNNKNTERYEASVKGSPLEKNKEPSCSSRSDNTFFVGDSQTKRQRVGDIP